MGDEDLTYLNRRFDSMCTDFSELKKFVEEIAATQIRIEAVFVSQKEMMTQYNGIDKRLTRIETILTIMGGVLTILGAGLIGIGVSLWT